MLTPKLCNVMLSPMTNLLTTAQACRELGLKSRSSLTRYVADGRIAAAMRLDGATGAYLFATDEVARFKAEREKAAAA